MRSLRPFAKAPPVTAMISVALLLMLSADRTDAISSRTAFAPTGSGGDQLGGAAAPVGDLNNDGYADVAIGAPLSDPGGADAGSVRIYLGGYRGEMTLALTLNGEAAGDQFGYAVAGGGDFNKDGYPDLLVGAPLNDSAGSDAGRSYLYYGGASSSFTLGLTLTGVAAGDQFGFAVAFTGDVDGEGSDDLIVGAPYNDNEAANGGRAYFYFGGAAPDGIADWPSSAGNGGGELYGYSVAGAGDVNGDTFADVLIGQPYPTGDMGRAYLFLGGTDIGVGGNDLTYVGGGAGGRLGASVASIGDANGDGFADVIVGAPEADDSGLNAGLVQLYLGSATPEADAGVDLLIYGSAPGDQFGASCAPAGDVNADGKADFGIGAPFFDVGLNGDVGRIYVHFGATTLDATPDLSFFGSSAGDRLGSCVAAAGDINGDAFADIISGAPRSDLGGSDAGQAQVTIVFPFEVLSPRGDETWATGSTEVVTYRGHDLADLEISFDNGGSEQWVTLKAGVGGREENRVRVDVPALPATAGTVTSTARLRLKYSGQAATRANSILNLATFRVARANRPTPAVEQLRFELAGESSNDEFGSAVARVGDWNADGYEDIAVGSWKNDAGGIDAGRVYLYKGGRDGDLVADFVFTGTVGDNLGFSITSAGDVNGDTYDDLLIGAPRQGLSNGKAHVYFGGPNPNTVADLTLTGSITTNGHFGGVVANAGDIDGDGFDDILVTEEQYSIPLHEQGAVFVFRGSAVPDAAADLVITGEAADDHLGSSLGAVGDLNGDRFDDFVVGAPYRDANGVDAGEVTVYLGSASIDGVADFRISGAAAGDLFGRSVAGLGDVNGDGFRDFAVGATFNDVSFADAGQVVLHLGARAPDTVADLVVNGQAAYDYFGQIVSAAGDVNADGFDDFLMTAPYSDAGGDDAGRAYVCYGNVVLDAGIDLTFTGSGPGEQFGIAAASGGDQSTDGHGDFIIGAPGFSAQGRARLLDMNSFHVVSPNGGETWIVGSKQTVTWLGQAPWRIELSDNGGGNREQQARWTVLKSGAATVTRLNSVTVNVPQQPTHYALIRIVRADLPESEIQRGEARSATLFTVQADVELLNLDVERDGQDVVLSWQSQPGVSPDGLAGYRLYRQTSEENGVRIGPELIVENRYVDHDARTGTLYRLMAVNGLGDELMLAEFAPQPMKPLLAWPLPYRGGSLHVNFATASGLGGGKGNADVGLYDAGGRRVRTLASGAFAPGINAATWDGRDDRGVDVPSGIYFLHLLSAGQEDRMKVVVIR